jgi:hypothetical protein
VPWTAEEKAAIERGFGSFFITLERPRLQHFEEFMQREAEAMKDRTLKKVKDIVQAKITNLKNKQKGSQGNQANNNSDSPSDGE